MNCPNCGAYRHCYCTWDEKLEAMRIIKRREAESRRRAKRPTVIEEERQRQWKRGSRNVIASLIAADAAVRDAATRRKSANQ